MCGRQAKGVTERVNCLAQRSHSLSPLPLGWHNCSVQPVEVAKSSVQRSGVTLCWADRDTREVAE